MIGKFKIDKPEELQATLTMTMNIAEWKSVQEQLGSRWPAGTLNRMIQTLIRKAESSFNEEIDSKEV